MSNMSKTLWTIYGENGTKSITKSIVKSIKTHPWISKDEIYLAMRGFNMRFNTDEARKLFQGKKIDFDNCGELGGKDYIRKVLFGDADVEKSLIDWYCDVIYKNYQSIKKTL